MRLLIVPFFVLLIFAGWTGYWFFAAHRVEASIERWIAEQRAAGAEISHAGLTVGGFPFRIRVDLAEPRLALPQRAEQPRWQTAHLSAIGHPWSIRHLIVDASGRHELSALIDGRPMTWQLDSRQALASWEGDDAGRLQRLSVDLHDNSLSENGAVKLRTARTQLHLRPAAAAQDLFDLALDLADAEIFWPLPPALEPKLARAQAQFTVTGRAPFEGSLPTALTAWRDAGGTLDVSALALDWGRLTLQGQGTLALDQSMRPMGAFTTKLGGYEVLLDVARDDGQMTDGAARAAKAVLGLLAAVNGGMLSVPVRLQDGEVFLGPVLIARLSPLLPAS